MEQFNRDGFLVLPKWSSAAEMQQLQAAARQIMESFDASKHRSVFYSGPDRQKHMDEYFLTSGDKVRCFLEPGAFTPEGELRGEKTAVINKLGHAMHELDPTFRAFSYSDAFRNLVASLDYSKPAIVQSMYITKSPRIGAPVDLHQDSTFLFTVPQSVTGFWWAVEDASLENGCLWAVPGSHKLGNKSRYIRTEDGKTKFDPPQQVLSDEGAVPVECERGTLVMLHGDLVHFSKDNKSDKSRHAFTLHTVETGRNVVYPATNWLQREDRSPFPTLFER